MSVGASTDGTATPGGAPPGSAIEDAGEYEGRKAPDTGGDGSNPPQNAGNRPASPKFDDPNNIRALRKSLALNQREFARLLAVSAGTVGGWESGGRVPNQLHQRLLGVLSGCFGGNRFYSGWRQELDRSGTPHSLEAFLMLTIERRGEDA